MLRNEMNNRRGHFWVGIAACGVLLLFCSLAWAQNEPAALKQKKAQSEVAADSNEYVIGPEDILYIHIWKEEALSRSVPVRIDGKISLPLIDDVKAEGLTPLELKKILIKKFQEFIDVPNISVLVMESNSYKVYVSGEVRSPGVFRIRHETTLLQIIPMVGGFTPWANQKKIMIIRKEKGEEKRIRVNYKKLVDGTDSSKYILQPGDIIVVP